MIAGKSFFFGFFRKKACGGLLGTGVYQKRQSFKTQPFNLNNNQFSFSNPNDTYFIFNLHKQPQLLSLQLQYRAERKIEVFEHSIMTSTGILEQMNIFKIFKVMESSEFNFEAYEDFFNCVNNTIKRKSDNMLLLLAIVRQRMAKNSKANKDYQNALIFLEEALQILERCLVPQLLPYYSIYRQYGLLHNQLGDVEKAKQILRESVQILESFVTHSDDNVITNNFCRKQATAYNVLVSIDRENTSKWISKANMIWQQFTENKFVQIQYAQTVAYNLAREYSEDKQKGQAYYRLNYYKFENEQMRGMLKRAKEQNTL